MIEFNYMPAAGWIVAFATGVLLVLSFGYYKTRGKASRPLKVSLIALRILAIAAVVICLLDPQSVEMIKHEQRSRLAVLLDTSKSMSIQDVGTPRLNAAKEWIANQLTPMAPAGVTLATYSFDQQLSALPALDSASATGKTSAVAESLEALLAVPTTEPLLGVVLVSDGIDNASPVPENVARTYRRKGIPIHTVTVGSTNEMEDVILENVQVKRAVPNEAPTRIAFHLRSPGFAGKSVSLQVRAQKNIIAAREVRLNGGTQRVEIDFVPRQKGFQVFEATVSPHKGEWLVSNNRRLFGLDVVDPTLRVLYMEGTPQTSSSPMPEWKYLKDALQSDPNIQVKVLYRQFGNDGKFLNTVDADPETGERIFPVEHPRQGFPRTLAGLLEYDVIIHSDIKKESFTPEQLQNIARLVEEHGGGFVMIGGNSAFGKGGYHRTILDRIIPVAMEQANDSQNTPFKLAVARNAHFHPIMNLGATPEETHAIWTKKFPILHGFNRVDRAKPGATVLAENPAYITPYGSGVLLAVQEVGKGRTMAFASDTTRSWGKDFETVWGEPIRPGTRVTERNCDGRYYRQFWVNAVRWLANGKMGRTNSPVTLELAQTHTRPGQPTIAKVQVRDANLREISNAEVSLLLGGSHSTNPPIAARYDAAARAYVCELRPLTSGTFIVTASAKQKGRAEKLGEDRQLLVAENEDLEMADLRARPDFMAALARDANGENLSLRDSRPAPPGYIFAKAPPPRVEFRRESLWDKSTWLGIILLLLAGEWALRRARGLA